MEVQTRGPNEGRGHGRIVHLGSIHSLVASPYKSAYVAAKHGLVGLARTLALETADTDITVNVVCPAYVRTPLVDNQILDQARERGITPDDVVSRVMLKPMPKARFTFSDNSRQCPIGWSRRTLMSFSLTESDTSRWADCRDTPSLRAISSWVLPAI